MASGDPNKQCILCKTENSGMKFSLLYDKDLKSLIEKCKQDNLLDLKRELNYKHAAGVPIYVHVICRKRFTYVQPKTKVDPVTNNRTLRSTKNLFNCKENFLLCEKRVNPKSIDINTNNNNDNV